MVWTEFSKDCRVAIRVLSAVEWPGGTDEGGLNEADVSRPGSRKYSNTQVAAWFRS